MNADSVTFAAQADLVLLTVEMLRSPQSITEPTALAAGLAPQSAIEPTALAAGLANTFDETTTSEASVYGSPVESWLDLSSDDLDQLLRAGLGAASEKLFAESTELTPRSALEDVQRCARSLSISDWSDEYCRLFDGATACPLNQASYIRRDKGTILGDVSGFYNAFGWRGGQDTGERPDHLLCQLEFVAMLFALASRAPDDASREIVVDALSRFAREHMHDWLPAVCWQMCEESQLEYFGAVSQWLLVLWQSLTDLHEWPIDQLPDQRLKPIVDPDDPYECGAPDLHQIQSP